MRGAKPKATVLKLVTGNPGRRPLNAQEAKPKTVVPEPPEMMNAAALKEWHRLTPLLEEVGLIAKLDRAIIAAYCMAWLLNGLITDALRTHLGAEIFKFAGAALAPLLQGAAVLLVYWLILLWMYRRKLFLKI